MKISDTKISVYVLLVIAVVLGCLLWLTTGISGETDSITHYEIARYAFKYPRYFLDHWGKPLFTLFAAPLSQFGYFGAITFNLISGLLSGYVAYLILKKMGIRFAWTAIIFTVFTPTYLFIMFTSLTEIFFSLVLIFAIYLFISRRFIWSAIVISFIPFARTEGMMFIMLFFPVLCWVRQYKAIPFLFAGFIIYSLVGLPVYHDFFWFFTKMPYSSHGSELYGSGSFWYYFRHMHQILDYPMLILCISGLLAVAFNLKNLRSKLGDIRYITLILLIIPALFGFILAQSFLWWRGMMGVLASNRFICCVLPLSAVIATLGFDWLMKSEWFKKSNRFRETAFPLIFILFIISVVYRPFMWDKLPMRPQKNLIVMQHLTDWLKTTKYAKKRAFYTDPAYTFFMNIDPNDQQKCFKIYSYENVNPATLLKSGEILIWDAQFAGYEGKLSYNDLMSNNQLRLLNLFTPLESFTVIGGENYKIAVFVKAPRDTTLAVYRNFFEDDYEKLPKEQQRFASSEKTFSGKQSIVLSSENCYGPSAEGLLEDLPGTSNVSLKASVRVLNPNPDESGQIILVLSVEEPGHKLYKYVISKDSDVKYKPGDWFELSRTDVIEKYVPANGRYKVYAWYQGKNKIYIDDLKIEAMPVGYE